MPLLLGVTGKLSPLHGRMLSGTLVAAIFTLSLIAAALYQRHALWHGIFNWFWLWKEQPIRETRSLIYRELADYCDAKYTLLTQLTDPEKALPPLLACQQKAVDLINTCYQQMHMLSVSRDNSHKRLTRAFQVALDLQEHISVSLHQPE
nr:integral membrane protein, YccS/YhfK family [Candidatus Pantoea persica]